MAKSTHHVVPSLDGGWNVRKAGSARASKHFETKTEAISWGRALSRKQNTEFWIHKRDGTIERKDAQGRAPGPPPDRK